MTSSGAPRPSGLQAAVIAFAIRFRGVTIALACLLLGYGVFSLLGAKYDVFPEFAPPQVSIQTGTGQRASIRFLSPATRTDPKIQGVSFFYTADAASGALPGMNVVVLLPAGRPTPGVLVPAPAIVWLQGRAWVYLRPGTATFTRREIDTTLPAPDGGYVVPVAAAPPSESASPAPGVSNPAGAPGLPAGTLLVVSGAQTLLSEEFRAQIQRGD